MFSPRVGLGQVSHLWFGFGKFPRKIPNFSIFALRVKKNITGLGQKVPGPGSKVGCPRMLRSGWVGSEPTSNHNNMYFYCYWPAVKKGVTRHWPGYFLTQPYKIFLIRRENNWKIGILGGNFPNPDVADPTQPNPNIKQLTQLDPG